MDIFSAVSETALITLKARVVESRKQEPVIEDPIAVAEGSEPNRGMTDLSRMKSPPFLVSKTLTHIDTHINMGIEVCNMEKVKTMGIAEVRLKLTQLVEDASKGGQPCTIVSSSRAKAVLMGVDEYNALIEKLEDLQDIVAMNQAARNPEPRMSWDEHLNKLKKSNPIKAKASI